MEMVRQMIKSTLNYIKTLVKWSIVAIVVGIVCGLVSSAFHLSVDYVTHLREEYRWIILLLPLGGVAIVAIYKLCRFEVNMGTNRVIESVRSDKKVPTRMAPLIFASTVITHLFGGSAGREGAALQLGGSIGYRFGKIFRLGEKDMHLVVLLGMSAVFAALFGTPLTATVFVLEVISVGVIYYAGLVPCIISSVVAYNVSLFFGITPVRFLTVAMQPATASVMLCLRFCVHLSAYFFVLQSKNASIIPKNFYITTMSVRW